MPRVRAHWCEDHGRDRREWYSYRHEADWKVSLGWMLKRYGTPADHRLVHEWGIFPSNGGHGVVRDHTLSRQTGFLLRIPPIIMRHPANCQFISKGDNDHKARQEGRYRDADALTPAELFDRILEWTGERWHEHEAAKAAVLAFTRGETSSG